MMVFLLITLFFYSLATAQLRQDLPPSLFSSVNTFRTAAFANLASAPANLTGCVVVLSDLHIGSPFFTKQKNKSLLKSFLEQLATPQVKPRMVVLIGDILELWQVPFKSTPLKPLQLLQATSIHGVDVSYYMELLRKIATNGVRVVWVLGNHDMEANFENTLFNFFDGKIEIKQEEFIENGVRYEHGHRYDLFNAPDPRGYRPIGYYVARAAATSGIADHGSMIKMARHVAKWKFFIISELRKRSVFDRILKAIFNVALGGSAKPSLSHGWLRYEMFRKDQIQEGDWLRESKTVELRRAKNRYKGLIQRWHAKLGGKNRRVARMLRAALGDYRKAHEHVLEKVVVFGHTHEPKPPKWFSRDSGPYRRYRYANTGAWVDDGSLTYIQIDDRQGLKLVYYSLDRGHVTKYVLGDETQSSGFITIPQGWSCPSWKYGSNSGCDCFCGVWDPDCDNESNGQNDCNEGIDGVCTSPGHCDYAIPMSFS